MRGMVTASVVGGMAFLLLGPGAGSGATFSSHTIVLRQGAIPTHDGTNIAGAAVYTNCVDTYVDKNAPTTGYPEATTVNFGLWDGTEGTWVDPDSPAHGTRGYLRFDNFAEHIPAAARITSAVLALTSAGTNGGAQMNSELRYRTAAFDTNITWSTAGTRTADNVILMSVAGWNYAWAADDVQTVDIAPLARQWRSGAVTNHGLQFVGVEDGYWNGVGHRFYSSEYGDAAKRPTLTIAYVVEEDFITGTTNFSRSVELLSGASVMEDTYVDVNALDSNFSSATDVGIANWWGANPTRRALVRLNLSHPVLAALAQTGQPLSESAPLLKVARLEFLCRDGVTGNAYRLDAMQVTNDWTAATATANKYDGVNDWPEGPMTSSLGSPNGYPMNCLVPKSATAALDNVIWGGNASLDITSLLQAWVDGASNLGLCIGQDGYAYSATLNVGLTENSTTWYRPTLALELWTYIAPPSGSLIVVR